VIIFFLFLIILCIGVIEFSFLSSILYLWQNCWNSKLECKFMIGLSQGLGKGCIKLFVKNIDLNGVDCNVQKFG
jgi:hypothetical protein